MRGFFCFVFRFEKSLGNFMPLKINKGFSLCGRHLENIIIPSFLKTSQAQPCIMTEETRV